MRASFTLAVLALLAAAGTASASDYMLPLLLEPLDERQAASGDAAPAQPQSTMLVQGSGISFAAALFGAFAATAVMFLLFVRRPRAATRRFG